jgi:hypothetical protein
MVSPRKIAQEIGMFFEDQDRDSGACQQKPQHHASGAAAGNAATDRNLARFHRSPPVEPVSPTPKVDQSEWE